MTTAQSQPERIAVHMPNWVGDVVMATPALRMLRETFPDAEIALVIRPYAAPLMSGDLLADSVIDVDDKTVAGFIDGIRRLRKFQPDTSLVLSHSTRPAIMARLSGARRRIGYERGGRGALFTEKLHLPEKNGAKPQYMGRQYTALAATLGCKPDYGRPELPVRDDDETQADAILARHAADRPLVGITPGASFGGSKLWQPERFAAVANRLIDRSDARIIIPTAPSETAIRQRIESDIKDQNAVIDIDTPDLSLLKSIVKRLDLLITSDSGARHIAVAFDIPTVVLMGPTRPEYTEAPFERGIVIRHDVECGPCHASECSRDHICMNLITVDEVTNAAESILSTELGG